MPDKNNLDTLNKNNLNIPNFITLIRILFIFPISYFLYIKDIKIALFFYAVFLVLDKLDGVLARKLKCETVLGRNLDFIADRIVGIAATLTLIIQGYIPNLYLILAAIPALVALLIIPWGLKLVRTTFITSNWDKLSGAFYYITLFLFIIQTSLSVKIAYFILIYFYIAEIQHVYVILKFKKNSKIQSTVNRKSN